MCLLQRSDHPPVGQERKAGQYSSGSVEQSVTEQKNALTPSEASRSYPLVLMSWIFCRLIRKRPMHSTRWSYARKHWPHARPPIYPYLIPILLTIYPCLTLCILLCALFHFSHGFFSLVLRAHGGYIARFATQRAAGSATAATERNLKTCSRINY